MKKTYQMPTVERMQAELTHFVCGSTIKPAPGRGLGQMHNVELVIH